MAIPTYVKLYVLNFKNLNSKINIPKFPLFSGVHLKTGIFMPNI